MLSGVLVIRDDSVIPLPAISVAVIPAQAGFSF